MFYYMDQLHSILTFICLKFICHSFSLFLFSKRQIHRSAIVWWELLFLNHTYDCFYQCFKSKWYKNSQKKLELFFAQIVFATAKGLGKKGLANICFEYSTEIKASFDWTLILFSGIGHDGIGYDWIEQERTEATEQDKMELDGTELWLKSFRLWKKHMIASYYISFLSAVVKIRWLDLCMRSV